MMGFKDFMRRRADEFQEAKADFELGCQIIGRPSDPTSVLQRQERMAAGKKERQRREAQARMLGSAVLKDVARQAYVAHRRHQVAGKENRKETQFEANGIKVKVSNGYSGSTDDFTTDVVVVDPQGEGKHIHIIFDEHGRIVYEGWNTDH
ncbi:hypothetical protein ACWECC_25020 [Streptomyces microflavus]|uniref:hypothetical protein n=1 Tax=Streptomyces microflavus TaxID=1919 RepID=UPI00344815D1